MRQRIGILQSSANSANFGKMFFGQHDSQTIEIENSQNSPVEITLLEKPEFINFKISNTKLKPGKRTELEITYDSKLNPIYGSSRSNIDLEIKVGGNVYKGIIVIIAQIVEDFSALNEKDLKNSPQIHIPNKRININTINNDDPVEVAYRNIGKNDLKIRNIEINNIAYKLINYDKVVKSGETGKFSIQPNLQIKSQKLNTSIKLISNDPVNSQLLVQVFGTNSKYTKVVAKDKYKSKVRDVSVEEAYTLVKKYSGTEKMIILDVRTPDEFIAGAIPGAVNIDVKSENFNRLVKLLPKENIYLVYCKAGTRSKKAIEIMKKYGFKEILHMYNGMDSWIESDLEFEKFE